MSDKHEFITVEKVRMTRCLWCGTLESKNWIEAGRSAGCYCSSDCALAANVEFRQEWVRILTPFGIILIIIGIVAFPLQSDFEMIFITITLGVLLECSSVICRDEIAKGQQVRSHIPRDSRKNDRPLDLVLLERAKPSALCPNCGANLILAEIEPDRTFKCKYCGAEGIMEWPPDDEDVPKEE